jgi:predicted Rossmann-fold nucleotide-binding protein
LDGRAAVAVLGPTGNDAPNDVLVVAAQLGEELARAGYTVVVVGTGGVSRRAANAASRIEGQAVAVLTDAAQDLDEGVIIREAETSLRALEQVLELADATLTLPGGGLEALALLLQIWADGITRDGLFRQMVAVGPGWRDRVAALAEVAGLDRRQRAMVSFCDTPEEAVEALRYYVPASG